MRRGAFDASIQSLSDKDMAVTYTRMKRELFVAKLF